MANTVRNNAELARYEIIVDGQLAGIAEYRLTGDTVVFPHTEIEPDRRGQGLGEELVRNALDDVRGSGHKVVPHCWFVADFIRDNPDYRDLLAA